MDDADIEAEVRAALDAGASPNAREEGGDTLLLQAIENNRPSVVRLLLRRGADANLPNADPRRGDTPLTRAVWTRDPCSIEVKPLTPLVKMLLQRRAAPNRDNREGDRPLTLAAMEGHCEIAALLVHAGADVRLRDGHGLTPLALATGCETLLGGGGDGMPPLTRPNDPKQVEKDTAAFEKESERWARAEERRLAKARAQMCRLLLRAGAKA